MVTLAERLDALFARVFAGTVLGTIAALVLAATGGDDGASLLVDAWLGALAGTVLGAAAASALLLRR